MQKGRGLKKFVTRLLIGGKKIVARCLLYIPEAREGLRMGIDGRIEKVSSEHEGRSNEAAIRGKESMYVIHEFRIPCKCG